MLIQFILTRLPQLYQYLPPKVNEKYQKLTMVINYIKNLFDDLELQWYRGY